MAIPSITSIPRRRRRATFVHHSMPNLTVPQLPEARHRGAVPTRGAGVWAAHVVVYVLALVLAVNLALLAIKIGVLAIIAAAVIAVLAASIFTVSWVTIR